MVRRNLNNRLFAALLGSVLIVFVAAVAMLLMSNVVYLAGAEGPEGESGWELFVAGVKDAENRFAIRLSLVTATITVLIAMVVGIPGAYVLSRYRLPGSGFIDTLLDLPIVLPPPVMGISLLIFFSKGFGRAVDQMTPQWAVDIMNSFLSFAVGHEIEDKLPWTYTTRGIVLAQFFVACPFGVRAIKAAFDTIGRRHEDVARTLGCTQRQAFFRVVLPMARSGILAGAIMTWARAIAEFGPILFFCGATRWKTEVMPVGMYLHYSIGDIENAVALVLVMVITSTVTLLTFKKLGGQGYLW